MFLGGLAFKLTVLYHKPTHPYQSSSHRYRIENYASQMTIRHTCGSQLMMTYRHWPVLETSSDVHYVPSLMWAVGLKRIFNETIRDFA